MAEKKQMMYMNILICGSDSDEIIQLENQLEEVGKEENIRVNIDTNICMNQQLVKNWVTEKYDILFVNLDNTEKDGL